MKEELLFPTNINPVASENGSAVKITFIGDDFSHAFVVPTESLGTLVENLFKIWGAAKTTHALAEGSPNEPPPANPSHVFHAENVDVVTTSGGSATIRIYPLSGPPVDVIFRRTHLEFALAAMLATEKLESPHAKH